MSCKSVCICIREAAPRGFQNHFINQAHAAVEACKEQQQRKARTTSVPNTYMGRGFAVDVEEDLAIIKENEEVEARK